MIIRLPFRAPYRVTRALDGIDRVANGCSTVTIERDEDDALRMTVPAPLAHGAKCSDGLQPVVPAGGLKPAATLLP